MALLSLQQITVAFGGPPVLDAVSLQVQRGDRIALVGRNGEGKSTFLKVLAGELDPDGGEIVRHEAVRVGALAQEVPQDITGTVRELIAGDLAHLEEWEVDYRIEDVCSHLAVDPEAEFAPMSGGQKRRALLSKALALEPDVLVLDEPTNHLDLEAIQWLENFVGRYKGAVLFVTHDRVFQRKIARSVVELDRGTMTRWDCDYDKYLERREEALATEQKHQALFDKKLAQEEVWIRQGIKARRTRNEGRVRALEKLRNQRRDRRELGGPVKMSIQQGEKSGRKVLIVEGLNYAWDTDPIIKDLDLTLMRGDKVGIIGPNGCGKSTLMKLLLEQLKPDSGTVEHGTKLELAYFDQHRVALDGDLSVAENVAPDQDFVTVDGKRRHIMSYLADFLFTSDRARTPVRVLSGGERNRLLLARLFLKETNMLVLDEPTNDLDAETLELLENLLVDYRGTLLLVSHDRALLNNVVTSTLVFEGEGVVTEFVGGYDDWVDQAAARAEVASQPVAKPKVEEQSKVNLKRLNNREREELKRLPEQIEEFEKEQLALTELMLDPAFFKRDVGEVQQASRRAEELPKLIKQAYDRWDELAERS